MRRFIILFIAMLGLGITSLAQNTTDSIYQAFLRDFKNEAYSESTETVVPTMHVPRYKMFPTQNNNILLKLDTKRGRIWMVQYRMNDQDAMEVTIDNYSAISEGMGWNGRFEMYPTVNMYNFLMIDTETGQVYQVQWSFKQDKRFVERIY